MAKKTAIASTESLEPRIYEIGYLLSPSIRDEDLETRLNELKETLTKFGATFITEGAPEFIDLAYEMTRVIDNKNIRFTQGYFGWVKIEIDPKSIASVKEYLDGNTLVIRYLLILTTKENTMIGKRPIGKMLKGSRKDVVDAVDMGLVPETSAADEIAAEPAVEDIDAALDADIKEMVKEA